MLLRPSKFKTGPMLRCILTKVYFENGFKTNSACHISALLMKTTGQATTLSRSRSCSVNDPQV